MQLNDKDKIISLSILDNMQINNKIVSKDKKINGGKPLIDIFCQSQKMVMEKDRHISDYRVTNRGGKGIIGIINSPRNGKYILNFNSK